MAEQVFPISRVNPRGLWLFYMLLAVVSAAPLGVGMALTAWPSRVEFELAPAGLTVRGSGYGRSVPTGSIDTFNAFRLQPAHGSGNYPRTRTNGVGMPNYQAGWFTLNDGQTALLFVTNWSRAVVVPTTDGYLLILSPDDPDEFVKMVNNLDLPDTILPRTFPVSAPPENQSIWRTDPTFWLIPIAILFFVFGLMTLFWILSRNVRFVVGDESLRIRGDLYGRTIPRSALVSDGAEVVDLRGHSRFGWMLRVNGIGMPGYAAGWFRPAGGGRALAFITDKSRVVVVPTSLGYTLLVSPADPFALLAALKTPASR